MDAALPRAGKSAARSLDDYLRRQVPPYSTTSPSVPVAVNPCAKPTEQQESQWESRDDDAIDEHLDAGSRHNETIHTAYHEQILNELADVPGPFKDCPPEGADASEDWIERLNGRRRKREMLYPRAGDILRHGAFNEWSRASTFRSSQGSSMRAGTDRASSRLVSFMDEYRDGLEASWFVHPDKSEVLEYSSSPESISSGSERRYAERRVRRRQRRHYSKAAMNYTSTDGEEDARFPHRVCRDSCEHCLKRTDGDECVCNERTLPHRGVERSHDRMESLLQQVVMLLKKEGSGRTRPGRAYNTRRRFSSTESSSGCSCSHSSASSSRQSSISSSSNSCSSHYSTKRKKKRSSAREYAEESPAAMREARVSSSNRTEIHQARTDSSEQTPCSGCELSKLEIQRLKLKLMEHQQQLSSNHCVQRTCRCDSEQTSTTGFKTREDRGAGADVNNDSVLGCRTPMMDAEYRAKPCRRRRSRYRIDSANAVGDDDVDDILDRQEHRMNSFIRRRLHSS